MQHTHTLWYLALIVMEYFHFPVLVLCEAGSFFTAVSLLLYVTIHQIHVPPGLNKHLWNYWQRFSFCVELFCFWSFICFGETGSNVVFYSLNLSFSVFSIKLYALIRQKKNLTILFRRYCFQVSVLRFVCFISVCVWTASVLQTQRLSSFRVLLCLKD